MPTYALNGGALRRAQVEPGPAGYDVIILGGQSNMAGYAFPVDATLDAAHPRIKQFALDGSGFDHTIIAATDPLRNGPPDVCTGVGPATHFAKAYLNHVPANRTVLIVPTALGVTVSDPSPNVHGGTGQWRVGGTYYNQCVEYANDAIEAAGAHARVVAFLWGHGEGDSAANATQAQYAAAIDATFTGLRSSITGAADMPVILSSMTPAWRNAPHGTSLQVHAAQVDTPNRLENAHFVAGPSGQVMSGDGVGDIHYNPAGIRTLGAAMAAAIT